MCIWQFPLIALGAAVLLLCAVSPALPFQRKALPGAAFIASIAYSVYLSHKLAIHAVETVALAHDMQLNSPTVIAVVVIAMTLVGTGLFFAVERPFLQMRQRRG